MKKLISFVMLISSLSLYSQIKDMNINNVSNALVKAPHEIDTLFIGVEHRDPRYMYGLNWFDEYVFNPKNYGTRISGGAGPGFPVRLARYYYTDTTLPIIGIAVVASIHVLPHILEGAINGEYSIWDVYVDTSIANRVPEYVQLFEATDTSFEMIAEERWDDPSNKPAKKMEFIDIVRNGYDPVEFYYENVYEVYFEHPVVVNDSFYVGWTAFNNTSEYHENNGYHSWTRFMHPQTHYYGQRRLLDSDTTGYSALPGYFIKKYDRNEGPVCYYEHTGIRLPGWQLIDTTVWYYMYDDAYFQPAIFPIIDTTGYYLRFQDTCADVSNFNLVSMDMTSATFSWDNNTSEHVGWQIAYGEEGTAVENCTFVNTGSTVCCLSDLDSAKWYVAYVRAQCDTNDYSNWSDSIRFYITGDTTQVSIRNTVLEEYTHLIPNPASDIVSIFSSFSIRKVEVYSLKGEKLIESDVENVSISLDVSTLPKGIYLVKVYTPKGVATKKLVVN